MNTIILKTGILFLLSGLIINCYADYTDELLKLSRIDLLPRFQEKVISKQISSYDTTGGNDDGFSGKYSYIRKENGNLVLAELEGPGIIHRIWTPTPTNDTIQFYFDGETKPRIELKFIDIFSGKQYPFKRPVVGNEVGGYYCYIPIPYKKSCKILYKGDRMQFFQIQYSEVSQERINASFPEKYSDAENEALEKAVSLWSNYGDNILNMLHYRQEVKTFSKNFTIRPGETIPFFTLKKGGRILGIEITPEAKINERFKDLILRAEWDNDPVAAINSPLSDFFGYAFGKPSVKSLLLGVRGGIHYCYIPMPFDISAAMELQFLKNSLNTQTEIPVSIKVFYAETKRSANEGKFYAEWRREKNPETGKPYLILNKSGRGHYIGTLLQSQGLNHGVTIFFEGDDQCFVDGELRLHGTGSEDYFNGGWYALPDRWDQAFSLPVHGCLGYSIPLARTGGFRFMVTDKISFEEEIVLTIEHGPVNNTVPVDYVSVAFYYSDTPPILNDLPASDLLGRIETPDTLEYRIQLLPVKSLSNGATLSRNNFKDEKSGQNYNSFKLETYNNGFARFELEFPYAGEYKLLLSYLRCPEGGQFDVNQRQIPVRRDINGYAPENTFIEKEYMGNLYVDEGANTITVMLKGDQEDQKTLTFILYRIYLVKDI